MLLARKNLNRKVPRRRDPELTRQRLLQQTAEALSRELRIAPPWHFTVQILACQQHTNQYVLYLLHDVKRRICRQICGGYLYRILCFGRFHPQSGNGPTDDKNHLWHQRHRSCHFCRCCHCAHELMSAIRRFRAAKAKLSSGTLRYNLRIFSTFNDSRRTCMLDLQVSIRRIRVWFSGKVMLGR